MMQLAAACAWLRRLKLPPHDSSSASTSPNTNPQLSSPSVKMVEKMEVDAVNGQKQDEKPEPTPELPPERSTFSLALRKR